jgi:hypothetical protein
MPGTLFLLVVHKTFVINPRSYTALKSLACHEG